MAESKAKRYYWLRLKEGFFREREIKKMCRLENGRDYIVIYLKLMLLGVNSKGCLIFEGCEENMFEQLALELDEDPDLIEETIDFCIKNNLLQIDGDEYFFTKVPDLIGSEGGSAARMRSKREKESQEASQCDDSVPTSDTVVPMSDNSVTDELLPVTNCDVEKEKTKDSETIEKIKNQEGRLRLNEDSNLDIDLQAKLLEEKLRAKKEAYEKHNKPEKGLVPLVPESAPPPPPPPSEKNDISLSDEDIKYFIHSWNNLGVEPIKELSEKQIQKLEQNVKQFGDGQVAIDAIGYLFDSITDSSYLLGETDPEFNLMLNWVLVSENWGKIIIGAYCNWEESTC